jgi:hypothetical protein
MDAIAFEGDVCIASGELSCVALAAKKAVSQHSKHPVLVFNARTSELIELDLRGSRDDVLRRLPVGGVEKAETAETPRGRGRPKLGVVAREVTLLPRHWDWLSSQPGGASVALRKLVEQASRTNADKDRVRAAQNAAYRFMSAMAGDRMGFEDASRALFAGDRPAFEELVASWPADIGEHIKTLATGAFQPDTSA